MYMFNLKFQYLSLHRKEKYQYSEQMLGISIEKYVIFLPIWQGGVVF